MEYILDQVADRSPTSCSEVAERSPISRRPIADQSPTSFSDSHAPILTKLVGDRSATSRRLVGDFAGTSLQRGPRTVADFSADFSATSPGPIGDLVATSAIGVNCQSRRGRKAVARYVWPGLYLFQLNNSHTTFSCFCSSPFQSHTKQRLIVSKGASSY